MSITLQVVLLMGLFSTLLSAQTRPISATIDVSKAGAPISKYIYGQFLEHIGGIVNNGVWAEMLDDRKFYYPINSHQPAEDPPRGFMRMGVRHWTPIGGDEYLPKVPYPYAGDHSPGFAMNGA